MNKDNVFRSQDFFMATGDVLHMLLIDESGNAITFNLVGGTSAEWEVDIPLGDVPGKPVVLPASDITITGFTANWQFLQDTTGFYLDVAIDSGFTLMLAGYANKDVGNVNTLDIVGLSESTDYYYRVRAYNDIGTGVSSDTITLTTLELAPLLDIDGNEYQVVVIGNQEWIVEPLRTTHYSDGTPIANLTVDTTVNLLTGWTNVDFDTFTSSGSDVTDAVEAAATYGHAKGNDIALLEGEFLYYIIDLTLVSGNLPLVALYKNAAVIGTATLHAGLNSSGFLVPEDNNYSIGFVSPLTGTRFNATVELTSTYNKGWAEDTTGSYCWYQNNIANKDPYGALYNHYAVTNAHGLVYFERAGVEETGWSVPTLVNTMTLATFAGGDAVAGGKLKEIAITHWQTPNTNASDEYGFQSVPSGYREAADGAFLYGPDAVFTEFQTRGFGGFWTTTLGGIGAYGRWCVYNDDLFNQLTFALGQGLSVRCVRDITPVPSEYVTLTDGVSIIRKGVRGSCFVVDIAITPTGFSGTENTDWRNLIIW